MQEWKTERLHRERAGVVVVGRAETSIVAEILLEEDELEEEDSLSEIQFQQFAALFMDREGNYLSRKCRIISRN